MADEENLMPLAARQAPKTLEDFAGQPHLLGKGKMLRRLLETDTIKSAVFFGPPGCGKTATARYIASRTHAVTVELNAAAAGVADLKKVLTEAKERMRNPGFEERRTLVILDEIHHFNKTQQDVLLPSVERGDIILIGITTENPYFYINTALLSRFSVFEFKPLGPGDLRQILFRAAKKENAALKEEINKLRRGMSLPDSGAQGRTGEHKSIESMSLSEQEAYFRKQAQIADSIDAPVI